MTTRYTLENMIRLHPHTKGDSQQISSLKQKFIEVPFYKCIYYIFAFLFYRNSLKNLIIGTIYFLITWCLSNMIKLIISFVNHLYIIKIDKINVNCILFNKKPSHYIHNLLLDILRNFVKLTSFPIQRKPMKPLKNQSKSIKIALNGIN